MAVTDWIDALTRRWGTIEDGRGGTMRSYGVFERAEMPESLSQFPCVVTYITGVPVIQYSQGGPNVIVYNGVSEFHVTPNVSKGNYPYLMTFYDKIIVTAAGSITLGGLVQHFLLAKSDPIKPAVLTYGSDEPHLGLVVNWEIKEIVQLSVSA